MARDYKHLEHQAENPLWPKSRAGTPEDRRRRKKSSRDSRILKLKQLTGIQPSVWRPHCLLENLHIAKTGAFDRTSPLKLLGTIRDMNTHASLCLSILDFLKGRNCFKVHIWPEAIASERKFKGPRALSLWVGATCVKAHCSTTFCCALNQMSPPTPDRYPFPFTRALHDEYGAAAAQKRLCVSSEQRLFTARHSQPEWKSSPGEGERQQIASKHQSGTDLMSLPSGVRRLWVGGVAVGDCRGWQAALESSRHCVMFVQKLLPQGLHFTHLLVGGAVRHVLSQRLEAHVDLFDPVPLSLVPPGHGHGLLLRDGVAQSVEAQTPLAAQELRRAGALSLQHLGLTLEAGRVGAGVLGGVSAVLGWSVQADAGVSFGKSKGECSLRGGDGCRFHLADSSSEVMDAEGERSFSGTRRAEGVGSVQLSCPSRGDRVDNARPSLS
ncbi:hypothetical protein EYF80_001853 [Liparis tanakae]|uniref:Uncharacterized protein n=1 Tax=Liparis tanakae TaxID=230148 RepID=A0A4Z2JCE4_9TELE|nr:hypothetical protein EYF80_001853 [Liparis tanakae]